MNNFYKKLPLVAMASIAIASCTDYSPYEGSKADLEYAKNFKDKFGKIDPEQDWSMAAYAKAYVSGMEDGVLELLYADNIAKAPVLIAKRPVVNGEAEFNFNVVKGTKQVFARIKTADGKYTLNRYFDIIDGELVISSSATRAHGITDILSGDSRAVKSEAYSLSCPQLLDWNKSSQFELYTGDAASAVDYIDGYYRDKVHNQSIAGKSEFYHTDNFSNIYMLYNVIDPADERPWWYVDEIAPFFIDIDGQEGCFKESVNHVVLMKDGSKPHLEKDLVFTMEKEGVFYLDYFFKGTQYDNQFGYFYFTGDIPSREDFMTMPKFVLIDNMSTKGGQVTTADKDTKVAWYLLGNQGNTYGSSIGVGIDGVSMEASNWDSKVVGTRLYLTYFGKDGTDTQGKLEFPKDTKIGLFFIGNTDDNRVNKIITSISKLNLDLYNETPHAASFKLNDKVVFAMEDMNYGGDKDVNDAMFIAYGDFDQTVIPDIIVPVEPEAQNWVMACEDLGGSFDYDFNDLVFALRMTPLEDGENSRLDLIPLAAGGTLNDEIYYNDQKKGEIHSIVSPSGPIDTPINVTAGSSPSKGYPIVLESSISSETDINELAAKVRIEVTKDASKTTNAEEDVNKYNIGYHYIKDNPDATDLAPQVLLLPGGWDWPSEMTFICDVYPGFKDWTKDSEVTTWCNTKKDGATAFANNPLPYVAPSDGEQGGEQGGGTVTPPAPTGDNGWNITITGQQVMGMGTTQTITISVDGLEDYSNVECGTYSSSVITASKTDATHYEINTISETVRGTARFYVLVPGDATHATTRKVYEITVGAAVPEFYFVTNGNNKDRVTAGALTLDVNPNNPNVDLAVDVVKGDGNLITWSSSDENIVKVESNQLKRVACGTVTITATHAAKEDGNGSFSELSKSMTLTIAKLEPVFTVNITECVLAVGQTRDLVITHTTGVDTQYSQVSSNPSVATIPDAGLYGNHTITAVGEGTTTITITHAETDFFNSKSKTISVKVLPLPNLTANNITLGCGKTLNLVRGVNYNTLSDGDITVSVDGTAATVNGTQITTGSVGSSTNVTVTINQAATETYASGTCTFTLTIDPNAKDPATLSVTKTASVELVAKGEVGTISKGSDFDFELGASGIGVTYSSSNEAVMTVSESNGIVTITPKKGGTAQVLIKSAEDGTYAASEFLTIANVTVESNATTMVVGQEYPCIFSSVTGSNNGPYTTDIDLSSLALPNGFSGTASVVITMAESVNAMDLYYVNEQVHDNTSWIAGNNNAYTSLNNIVIENAKLKYAFDDGAMLLKYYDYGTGTGSTITSIKIKLVE